MTTLSFDGGADAYDRFMGRWSRRWIPALLAAARVARGQRVLDVATGTGEAVVMAATVVGAPGRIVGTDISLPMLRAGAPRAAGQPIALAAMDAQALAAREASFDAVICQLGLMLVPDPARALREWSRVLRPGGRVAVCVWSTPERVPLIGLLAGVLTGHLPALRDDLHRGFSLGEPGRLEGLLASAGFGEVGVSRETRRIEFDSFDDYWSARDGRRGLGRRGYPPLTGTGVSRVRHQRRVKAGCQRARRPSYQPENPVEGAFGVTTRAP